MSSTPYETYEAYERHGAYERPRPYERHAPYPPCPPQGPHGTAYEPQQPAYPTRESHEAEARGAGEAAGAYASSTPVQEPPSGHLLDPHPAPAPPYQDTYRPAYEAAARPVAARPSAAAPAPPPVAAPVVPRQTGGRGGRRRARRRVPRPAYLPEAGVRRLLPQALVVAFLAGGTTAFVADDKAVDLSVDGSPRSLHTFADDVAELLADEGVRVGEHDTVVPAPGAALTSGEEVVVRYGRPVRLTLDGQRREVWTTARTVEGALREWGVRAEGAYLSTARSRPIGRAGLTLDVRTERAVTVMADGRPRTVRTNAATVREAVEQAGVTLRGQDTTSVPPDSFPRDGQTVTVLRITGGREVREEAIPFLTRRTADPTLFRGTEVVERTGRPGVRRVTYSLRTVNGVRQRPRRVESVVVRAPRTQIVKVGTRPHPPSVRGADHLNWQGLAQCESGGRPDAQDPSGTYGGLYQFDQGTWHGLGGTGRPQDAPAEEQTYRAKKLYVRRGAAPWPHCGDRLHS